MLCCESKMWLAAHALMGSVHCSFCAGFCLDRMCLPGTICVDQAREKKSKICGVKLCHRQEKGVNIGGDEVWCDLRKKDGGGSIAAGGDMAQEVGAVVWQSEGCRFDPTLSVSKYP